MSSAEVKGLLQIKAPAVIDEYIARTGIAQDAAIEKFYSSKTYTLLEDEKTKTWHFSTYVLTDMLQDELSGREIEVPVEG